MAAGRPVGLAGWLAVGVCLGPFVDGTRWMRWSLEPSRTIHEHSAQSLPGTYGAASEEGGLGVYRVSGDGRELKVRICHPLPALPRTGRRRESEALSSNFADLFLFDSLFLLLRVCVILFCLRSLILRVAGNDESVATVTASTRTDTCLGESPDAYAGNRRRAGPLIFPLGLSRWRGGVGVEGRCSLLGDLRFLVASLSNQCHVIVLCLPRSVTDRQQIGRLAGHRKNASCLPPSGDFLKRSGIWATSGKLCLLPVHVLNGLESLPESTLLITVLLF